MAMTIKDNPLYLIPNFNSDQDAIYYANKAKWIEPLLQQMIAKLKDLSYNADDYEVGWLRAGQTTKGNIYYEQWYRLDLCVRIMQHYKRRNIKGDPSMSSDNFQIPEFHSKEEAQNFARGTKYVPAIFDMLMDIYIELHNDHNSLADFYWDAIVVMEDLKRKGVRGDNSMLNGSSFYAGMEPIKGRL